MRRFAVILATVLAILGAGMVPASATDGVRVVDEATDGQGYGVRVDLTLRNDDGTFVADGVVEFYTPGDLSAEDALSQLLFLGKFDGGNYDFLYGDGVVSYASREFSGSSMILRGPFRFDGVTAFAFESGGARVSLEMPAESEVPASDNIEPMLSGLFDSVTKHFTGVLVPAIAGIVGAVILLTMGIRWVRRSTKG